mmetsp:Transcript_45018/g.104224  ORF Transcript_45018/g.104224 Transcript_45018/m.104224 type:complete len:552 (-) Transcript_45018:178-1833(-)
MAWGSYVQDAQPGMVASMEPVFPGMEADPEDRMNFLSTKYSYLMSRLKEEILTRESAQQQTQVVEQQLEEERRARRADAANWEEERKQLHEQLSLLKERPTVKEQSPTKHNELSRLRRDFQELQEKYREAFDELVATRAHVQTWRRRASEKEQEAEEALRLRDHAEEAAKHEKEAMRGALKAASTAKAKEQVAASYASKGERELQSREARLQAVRRQSQREARRASHLEQRLSVAEEAEAWAARLTRENLDLIKDLKAAQEVSITAQRGQEEASEARREALSYAGDLQSEVRALEKLRHASVQQAGHLEATLAEREMQLSELQAVRCAGGKQLEGLQSELRVARSECQQLRQQRLEADADKADYAKQLRERPGKLQEAHQRLRSVEEVLEKTQGELRGERRAKASASAEAHRSQERLRACQGTCARLRDRVRGLEEMQLRFPARSQSEASKVSSAQRCHSFQGRFVEDEFGPPRQCPTPEAIEPARRSTATPPRQRPSSAAPTIKARTSPRTPASVAASPRQHRSPIVALPDDVKALRDYISKEDHRQAIF